MRDAHLTTGPKRYYDDLEEAISVVAKVYPHTRREGSIGAWSWSVDDKVVAEAWLHATKPGWWVRIAKSV